MMNFQSLPGLRAISCILISTMVLMSSGCAAMFRGTSQTVRVLTQPEDKTVRYEGRTLKDGDSVTVRKHFDPPRFDVGTDRRPHPVDMDYDPDLWLIGDAAWLIVWIIPGLIAFGVDFGTGAWRHLDDPQTVYVPD